MLVCHRTPLAHDTPRRTPTALSALCVLLAASCSEVKRQTVDRADEYDRTVWTGAADCEDAAPSNMTSHPPRVGAWNIRFFPDSSEGPAADPSETTDVDWLSCTIASLGVDVLAVQEFKMTAEAKAAQQELVELLNERTGGDWKVQVSSCEPSEVQHPGFLYDGSRVTGSEFREIPAMNPYPKCSNDASPGFAGYFSVQGGPDFHFVSTHMNSGSGQNSIEGRQHALAAMPKVVADAQAIAADTDVLFAGDFNTSGCEECNPVVESTEEIEGVAAAFDQAGNPLRLLGASESCSREDGDKSYLLDHFAVADSMTEIPASAEVKVSGICEEMDCDRMRKWHEDARARLSDHCPLLLDLQAADED